MNHRLFVDVHVLQTVPPSNLNRDDAGTPKQATYGGVRRARVSSQAWKRATRTAFADKGLPLDQRGTRTRKLPGVLATRLAERTGLEREAALRVVDAALDSINLSQKDGQSEYLLFIGNAQIDAVVDLLAQAVAEHANEPEKVVLDAVKALPLQGKLGAGHPVDVALFGRMVADIPALNVDAATQVAHALSTHQAEVEFDYYTAVDDENPKEETGAGMIGTIEFNSATLYRYATVGVPQLVANLGGDLDAAAKAVGVFIDAFVTSMPSGKANSFAPHTAPSLVCVVLREDQPVNLVSAFENPVRPAGRGLAEESAARLAAELEKATSLWGFQPLSVSSTYADPGDSGLGGLGESGPFRQVVEETVTAVRERMGGGGQP